MQEDRRDRVLIIEDEASIGLMVAEILADEGLRRDRAGRQSS